MDSEVLVEWAGQFGVDRATCEAWLVHLPNVNNPSEMIAIAVGAVIVLLTFFYFLSRAFFRSGPAVGDGKKEGKNQRKKQLKKEEEYGSYHSDYDSASSDGVYEFTYRSVFDAAEKAEKNQNRQRKKRRQEEDWDAPDTTADKGMPFSESLQRLLREGRAVPIVDYSGLPVGMDWFQGMTSSLNGTTATIHSLRLNHSIPSLTHAKALGSLLQLHPQILSLSISRNPLGWKGLNAAAAGHLLEFEASSVGLGAPHNPQQQKKAEGFYRVLCGDGPSRLVALDLSKNKIGAVGCELLARHCHVLVNLRQLNLSRNNLHNQGAAIVASIIDKLPSLVAVKLARNSISAKGAESLAASLSKNPPLEILDLRFNRIGDIGCAALAAALETNTHIVSLHLRGTSLSGKGLVSLSKLLSSNVCHSLRVLNLSHNHLTDASLTKFPSFLDALIANTHLTALSLADNALASDLVQLSEAIAQNKSLVALSVANTDSTGTALRNLFMSLSKNLRICNFDISRSALNGEALRKIARLIRLRRERLAPIPAPSFCLTTHHTALRDTGLRQLLQAGISLPDHCDLTATELTGEALPALFDCIMKPNRSFGQEANVRQLTLSNNPISSDTWSHIAAFVKQWPALVSLVLDHTGLDDGGVSALAAVLPASRLVCLRLEGNSFGDKGLERLAEACKSNFTLTKLSLDGRHQASRHYLTISAAILHNRSLVEGFHLQN